ncbi:Oidioi.mRNA.OKI2018_I69.XSR.g14154.t1.cds [Oikopleura dioica]|uniref:Oidioi.mRNA.OKI2018_I69.XSR.g14154.t1.cds n=1 Tax=Oikopleura dioica TaxID=34765 RepID=A0ABN7S8Y6_OIKDI|nr:Oidioi.mRNA.OKI2018_I69.XSR.g14154.t1.cds [Oikopleura dioica]
MPGAAENRRTPPRSSPAHSWGSGSSHPSSSESEGRPRFFGPRRGGAQYNNGSNSWGNNQTPSRPSGQHFRRNRINSSSDTDSVERFAGARFSSPPSPNAVPLPPLEWLNVANNKEHQESPPTSPFSDELSSATLILKDILSFKA